LGFLRASGSAGRSSGATCGTALLLTLLIGSPAAGCCRGFRPDETHGRLAICPDHPDRGAKLAGGHSSRLIAVTLVEDVLINLIALRAGFGAAHKPYLGLAVLAFERD
jgi:hypothetical protein